MTSFSSSGPTPHITDEKTNMLEGEDACLKLNSPTDLEPGGRTKTTTRFPL